MNRSLLSRIAATLDSLPVVRVLYRMFARPSVASDFLLCVFSVGFATALILGSSDGPYDTDGWFLLATGREILENGIPYVNPWAYDAQGGEYSLVVQQWLHAVILYAAYSIGGYFAVNMVAVLMAAATATILYLTVRTVTNGSAPAFCFALWAVALMGCSYFFSVRPAMWTMMCLCAVVCVCVLARRRGKPGLYAFLPLIMLFNAQVHMSMMWLDVFAAACFLLPWDKAEISRGFARSRAPLAIVLVAMCLAAFVNPYGLDGALYLINSMGAAGYRDVLSEMRSILHPEVAVMLKVFFAAMIALVLLACASARRLPPFPFALLWVASMMVFASHVRCVWVATIATMLLVSSSLRSAKEGVACPARLGSAFRPWVFPLVCALLVGGMVEFTTSFPERLANAEGAETRLVGWELVEKEFSPIAEKILAEEEQGRVFVSWDPSASILEWEGVKVVFDLRPEIWEPGITHVEGSHPWRDFVDACLSDESMESYIRDGGWRWYVVPSASVSYLCEKYDLQVEMEREEVALLKTAS